MSDSFPSLMEVSSLAVAAVALVIAAVALRNSDRNSSAATLLAIMEAFRQGWERFEEPDPVKRNYHFHSLMNLFEVGCAIHQDRSVHGASKSLLEDYMLATLTMIAKDLGARAEITRMRNSPDVFEYLKRFLMEMRLKGHPHLIESLVNKDVPQSITEPAEVGNNTQSAASGIGEGGPEQ